tara:strand:- start:1794 stop:2807 length:1014 start_codon:yes stop_codon:yes gene_type:complete
MLDLIASVGIPLLGSVFAGEKLQDASSGAGAAYNEGLKYLEDVQIPNIIDQYVDWQNLVQQGHLTYDQAADIKADPSKLRDFVGNEIYEDAAKQGLSQLQEIAESGLTTSDLAALEDIRQRVATQERGAREAILQGARQRGISGSGLEMSASLAAQQSGADRRALESLLAAGRGEDRRMGAAQRAAQLGSQLRGQEFGEAQTRSEADRLIDQFNKQMQFRTQSDNLGRAERARFQNMADRRRAEEINAMNKYRANVRNADLTQQRFQNQLSKGQALMGGHGGVAASSDAQTDRLMKLYGGGIGGAGQILGGYFAGKGKDDDFFKKMQQYEKWKQGRS